MLHNSASVVVNRDIQPDIRIIGNEKTPIIVLDNFAQDITDIKHYACDSAFKTVQQKESYYPGLRVPLPKQYVIDVVSPLNSLIKSLYRIPSHLKVRPSNAAYSLVSTPAEDLALRQRIPHFDGVSPYYFAVLHYLADGPHGDTAFFRHKPTGFERVVESRRASYLNAVQHYFDTHGEPSPQYFTESTDHYEIFDQIAYKPNRLVIYPGILLHSILVSSKTDIDPNPATGRLTANIFIEFK
ncbi:MAG: DUF6445 family protein [Glaciecola sp.]